MTPSAGAAAQASAHPRRRRQPRFPLHSLAYVRLEHSNGGIIRDLTESGIAVQAVSPLKPGEEVALHFDLFSPRVRINTRARVRWAEENGQAGVSFEELPARLRVALRDWILVQMLTAAAVSGRDSMFAPLDAQLVLSSAARPAIALPALRQPRGAEIQWGFLSLSAPTFAILVDTVVLASAVLLFAISCLGVMGSLPPLPVAVTFLAASAAIFVAAYHLIFSDFLCGASPGKRLAQGAAMPHEGEIPAARFR
jgi:hypothetical protein